MKIIDKILNLWYNIIKLREGENIMGMIVCYNKGTEEGSKKGCQCFSDTEKVKIYLNLTNGIEWLEKLGLDIENVKFIRIQSCTCERHLWDKLIADLDYNFLLDLALGYEVKVYDTSARKQESRAMYQGLEFVKYVLNRVWFNKMTEATCRGKKCDKYFDKAYKSIPDNIMKKVKYLRKFLNTDKINLSSYCIRTEHDGDYEYYRKILIENS